MTPSLRLRVVIVNFNGGPLLERAVDSSLAAAWRGTIDVVVVDNASTDGSLAAVEHHAGVTVIRRDTNEGFGANNHAIADLLGDELEEPLERADVVALLNPDALVRPDTFVLLNAALDPGRRIGSAAPMIVFDRPFVEIEATNGPITIESVSLGSEDVTAQCQPMGDAYRLPGRERPVWRCPDGSGVRVPVARLGQPIQIRTGADSDGVLAGHRIDGVHVVDVASHALPTVTVIQNAGSELDANGTGLNRGFGVVAGSTNFSPKTAAWCGAAVLLHADYLADVGGFEASYFLYYEDIDLSLRGIARGWSTAFVSDAIVEHRHSDRAHQGTKLVEVLQHRNKLVLLMRNAPWRRVANGWFRAGLTPISIVATAMREPRHAGPLLRLAWWRVQSLLGAARMSGEAIAGRREVNQHRRIPARRVLNEATTRRH